MKHEAFMRHTEDGSQSFYPHSHFWIIFWTVPVTSQKYFDAHSFTVSTIEVIASLVFFMFYLCVKSNTLIIRTSLLLYYSFI